MKRETQILIILMLAAPVCSFAVQAPSPREISAAGQSEEVFQSQIQALAERQRKVNKDMSERLKEIERQNPELAFQYKGQIKKLKAAQKRMGLAAESLTKNDLESAFHQQTRFFQEATYIFVEGVNYFRDEKEKQAMPLGTFLDRQGDQVHYPKEKKMTLGQKPFFDAEKFKPSDVITHSYKEIEDSDSDKQSHLEVPEFGKPKVFGQKPDSEPQKEAAGAEEGSQGRGGLRSKTASVRKPASGSPSPKSEGSEKETQTKPGDQDAVKSGRTEAADDLNARNAEVKAGGGGAGAGAGAGGGDGGMMPQGDGMLPDGKGENPSLSKAAGWVPPGSAGAGNAIEGSPSGTAALAGGLSEAKGNLSGGTSAAISRGSSNALAGSASPGMGSGALNGGHASAGTGTSGSGLVAVQIKEAGLAKHSASAGGNKPSSGEAPLAASAEGPQAQGQTALKTSGGLGSAAAGKGEENAPLVKASTATQTAGGMGSGYALSSTQAAAAAKSLTSSGQGPKDELEHVPLPGSGLLDQGTSAGKAASQGESRATGTINLLEDAAKITGGLVLQDAADRGNLSKAAEIEGIKNAGGLAGDINAKEGYSEADASKNEGALPGSDTDHFEKLKTAKETSAGTPLPGDAGQALSGGNPSAGRAQKDKKSHGLTAREDNGSSSSGQADSAHQGLTALQEARQKEGGRSSLAEHKNALLGSARGAVVTEDPSGGMAGTLGTAQTEKAAGFSSQDKKETLNLPLPEIRTSGDSRGPERRGLASAGAGEAGASSSGTRGLEAGDGGPVGTAGGQSGSGFPGGGNAAGQGLQQQPPVEAELFQDNLKSGPPQSGSGAGQKDNLEMPQTLRTEQTALQPKDDRALEANNVAAIREWLLQERLLIQELKKFKPVKQVNNPNPPWEFYLLRQKQMLNQIRQLRRRIEFYGTKDEYFMELHKVSKIANRLLELLNAGEFTDYAIAGTSLEDLLEDIRMSEAVLAPPEGQLYHEITPPEQRVPDRYKPVVSRYFERLSRQ